MTNIKTFCTSLDAAGVQYVCDYPLSSLSSIRIGGPAAVVAYPTSVDSVKSIITAAHSCLFPFYVIGNGTNTLFPDSGYPGCIVNLSRMRNYAVCDNLVSCDAGMPFSLLSRKVSEIGLGDLAFGIGIPGTVGGAVYMNAGAFGGEIGEWVTKCTVLDTDNGSILELAGKDMQFRYRHSVFQDNPQWIILLCDLTLCKMPADILLEKGKQFGAERSAKQPLHLPSAGSAFKRPQSGYAAQMIDACGLKGFSCGDAAVSEKHAGFIVNNGHATAQQVKSLIAYIQTQVFNQFGVLLEPEIKIMEEFKPE